MGSCIRRRICVNRSTFHSFNYCWRCLAVRAKVMQNMNSTDRKEESSCQVQVHTAEDLHY